MAGLTKDTYGSSQPQNLLESTRILHLYRKGMTGYKAHILDSDKQTVLYEINIKSLGSPSISLYRGPSHGNSQGALVGTANFHNFSRTTDIKIGNSAIIPLRAEGIFTSSRMFDSILGPLKWQHDGVFSKTLSLVNARGEWIARFQTVTAVSKWGRFEIAPGTPQGGERLLDEIVLTGFAILETEKRQSQSSG